MSKRVVRAAGSALLGLGIIWAIQIVLLAFGLVVMSYAVGIILGLAGGYYWAEKYL